MRFKERLVVLLVLLGFSAALLFGANASFSESTMDTLGPVLLFGALGLYALVLQPRLESRALARRLKPVLAVFEQAGPMHEKRHETAYRNALLGHVLAGLTDTQKPESPLPTGTRVDAWFEHDGDDWYVTVKKGIDNQRRLTLQGEVEDILLHAPDRKRDMWIVIVIGLDPGAIGNPETAAQLTSLRRYAAQRSSQVLELESSRSRYIEVVEIATSSDP